MAPSILSQLKENFKDRMTVTVEFIDKVYGGIPKCKKSLDYFMQERCMSDEQKKSLEERLSIQGMTDEEKRIAMDLNWNVFEKDLQGNCCLWTGNIKAMLREIFTTLGLTQKRHKSGEDAHAGGKQTLQHGVSVCSCNPGDYLRIPFLIDGKSQAASQGYDDRIKHIEDKAGKRSVIGRHDYFVTPTMQFVLSWPRDGVYSAADIIKALCFCEDDGLGACRSQCFGQFKVIKIDYDGEEIDKIITMDDLKRYKPEKKAEEGESKKGKKAKAG